MSPIIFGAATRVLQRQLGSREYSTPNNSERKNGISSELVPPRGFRSKVSRKVNRQHDFHHPNGHSNASDGQCHHSENPKSVISNISSKFLVRCFDILDFFRGWSWGVLYKKKITKEPEASFFFFWFHVLPFFWSKTGVRVWK